MTNKIEQYYDDKHKLLESLEYSDRFKKAISGITGKPFKQSLLDFDLLEIFKEGTDYCICSHRIKHLFFVKHIESGTQYMFGRCCAMQFYNDFIEEYKDNEFMKSELDYYKRWRESAFIFLHRYKNCKVCKTEWTHNRCFHKGLCVECRKKRDNLGETKITMKKYLNKTLKDVFKEDPSYIKFCSENKTRQTEEFREYLKYN